MKSKDIFPEGLYYPAVFRMSDHDHPTYTGFAYKDDPNPSGWATPIFQKRALERWAGPYTVQYCEDASGTYALIDMDGDVQRFEAVPLPVHKPGLPGYYETGYQIDDFEFVEVKRLPYADGRTYADPE